MESNNESISVFILTHGRADNVITYKSLQDAGYTGKIYFIVDDGDKQLNRYIYKYGVDRVKIFNKEEISEQFDEGNNFNDRRTIIYARNACFKIAKELGIKYFIQLDDDYGSFWYRYISKDGKKLAGVRVNNMDKILSLYLDFFKSTNFSSIAFAQGGDFLGGVENPYIQKRPLMRKCMNSFICSTDREFQFIGNMNEDVCTYTSLASRGVLFGTIPMIHLTQKATQSQASGITDFYLKYGTYCKSFTAVMMYPSGVKVKMMNSSNKRIHHTIKWINTTPMIVSEKYKKY